MIILAIETSTEACSAALYHDDNTIEECFELCPTQHTEKILPQINQLLTTAGIPLKSLDAIAFGQGPGSFTGVRIASSVAQALGFGLQKPLLPVSTLRAIAQMAFDEKQYEQVMVITDARLQSVYWGLYRVNEAGIMIAVQPDKVGPESSVELPDPKGWHTVKGQYPHAKAIAHLGAYDLQQGHCVAPEAAVPQYVRDQVA